MKKVAISMIIASALIFSANTNALADDMSNMPGMSAPSANGKEELMKKVEAMHAAGASRDEMIAEVKKAESAGEINQEQAQKFITRINEKMKS